VTGRKLDQKIYYRYSGYPGGLKEITLRNLLQRHPTRVIEHAVRGMLPKNPLGRQMFKKLKVYAGPDHPHAAQQPEQLELR
jgi:large subunit ribosomal protein L13